MDFENEWSFAKISTSVSETFNLVWNIILWIHFSFFWPFHRFWHFFNPIRTVTVGAVRLDPTKIDTFMYIDENWFSLHKKAEIMLPGTKTTKHARAQANDLIKHNKEKRRHKSVFIRELKYFNYSTCCIMIKMNFLQNICWLIYFTN